MNLIGSGTGAAGQLGRDQEQTPTLTPTLLGNVAKTSATLTLLGRIEQLEVELHSHLTRNIEIETGLARYLEELRERLTRIERTLGV